MCLQRRRRPRELEILDLNDNLKSVISWEPSDKASENLERDPSQEAPGKQAEELGKKPSWSVTLDIPSKTPGDTRDENGIDSLTTR